MAPSGVWLHYEKREDGKKVQCLKCPPAKGLFKFCGSTTSMMTHLKTQHNVEVLSQPPKRSRRETSNNSDEDADDLPEDNSVAVGSRSPSTSSVASNSSFTERPASQVSVREGPLDKIINNVNAFKRGGVRDIECTNALLYMVSKDTMPLSTTERKGFRKFTNTLQPLYRLPCEPTVTKKLGEKYELLQQRVTLMIEKARCVCLTTDIWTQKSTMRSFLGLTVHFKVGKNTVSIELGARMLDERKTIENLKTVLLKFCEDWGIPLSKVKAVVSDGGQNIKGAIKAAFGNDKHINCLAHQLNNVGHKAMKVHNPPPPPSEREGVDRDLPDRESDIEDDDEDDPPQAPAVPAAGRAGAPAPAEEALDMRTLIMHVKKIVTYFRHSEVATSELNRLQMEELGKTKNQCLKLIQECRTRWNSCYAMVERYITLSPLVTRVLLLMQRQRSSRATPPRILTASEEEALEDVRDLLKPLYLITLEISNEKLVTLSKCIPLIKILWKKTADFKPTTALGFNLQQSLMSEIEQQFGQIEFVRVYAVATLLDPRFKAHGFGLSDKSPMAKANAITFVGNLVKEKIREAQARANADAADAADGDAAAGVAAAAADDLWGELDHDVMEQSAAFSDQDVAGGIPVELRQYLNRPAVPRTSCSNPYEAWETMRNEYPHVYEVAMDFLCIVATSVPCERLFSHAGLIASQTRSRLTGEHLEQMVFLRSCEEELWFS